jgi:hypothetical protein
LLPAPLGGNPKAPHQGTTECRGQGGHVVYMLMGFMNSSGQEVMCVYEPSSRPQQDDHDTARNSTGLDGHHGGTSSLTLI